MDSHRIIRANKIAEYVGLSRRHVDRLEGEGKFPRKVKLGENSVGWLAASVNAWIETRMAGHEWIEARIAGRDQAA